MLFTDCEAATRTNEYCEKNGIDFEIEDIHEFDDSRSNRFGLTNTQQTALRLAEARGYYSIPREVSTEDLANETGVSDKAFSEQLRRGHGNIVDHVLMDGVGTPEASKSKQTEGEQQTGTD